MSFSTKEVTEKVKGGGFKGKRFNPGNHRCKVNGIYTKEVEDKKQGGTKLQLWITLETEPVGGDFKGWAIDKNDESKGYFLGQVGNVKSNPYGYKSETKNGVTYVREQAVAMFLHILCLEANGSHWVEEVNGKYKTFEEFIDAFNQDNPIKDIYLDWCIGGQKSINDEGYAEYWMNLPKVNKGERVFKNPSKVGNLVAFDEVLHIYIPENQKEIASFGTSEPIAKPETKAEPKWDTEDDDIDFTPPTATSDDEDPFAVGNDDIDPFDVD
jgi:hypothetical protein